MEAFLHDISWVLPLRSDGATWVFRAFTAMGYLPFYLIAFPLGYWLYDKSVATRMALLVMGSALLNGLLKDVFDDPRPAIEFALDGQVGESYGLPSGHAQMAVVLWAGLAVELKRRWFWVVAVVAILGICFSRLYLGVHDVEDVLAGATLGAATLPIWFGFTRSNWMGAADWPRWLLVLVLLMAMPLMLMFWPEARGPGPLSGILLFMVGWIAGRELDVRVLNFQRSFEWWRAIAGAAIGVACVFGLASAVPAAAEAVGAGSAAGFVVLSLLVGLWVTALAPWLMQRARLAS